MSRLLIIRGPHRGVSYDLGDRTRVGRLGENEIQVADPNVSRIHAEVIRDGENYVLYDRGSKNGVVINDEAVGEKSLTPGDQIVIGSATFIFDPPVRMWNARYSCTPVIYLPPSDADIIQVDPSASKSTGQPIDDVDTGQLATVCLAAPKDAPAATLHLCQVIKQQFKASHAVLFLRDYPAADLYPIEAAPRQVPVFVNQAALNKCLETNGPVAYTTTLDWDVLNPFTEEGQAETSNEKPSQISILCTPVTCDRGNTGVLMVSYHGAVNFSANNVDALKMGAVFAALTLQVSKPAAQPTSSENAALDAEQRSASSRSLRMQEIYNSARRSASGNAPILITGETGTGEETLARYIHESSERSSAPFVVVQCSAIPAANLDREIFGAEEVDEKGNLQIIPGRIDEAAGGTLFLQEVGELDIQFQPKLLRFIQDKAYTRVGSGCAAMANVKLIAASSIDLAAAVRSGNFREDLWYRLNVVPFNMPPLRERREDVAPLLDFFVQYYTIRFNRKIIGANDSAIALLQKYDWPGNIRELNNAVERAVLLAESKVLSTSDFSHIEEARRQLNAKSDLERKRDTRPLAEVERQHIIVALKKHNFNQARAAEALGLHRNTLRNKIIEYGIEIPK